MIDRLAFFALAPLTLVSGLFGLDSPEPTPQESFGTTVSVAGGGLRIDRAADGLFYVPVRIGDQTLQMALDTGATRTVLPSRLTITHGLRKSRGGSIATLDGRVRFERVALQNVSIGSKGLGTIEVAVADVAFHAPLLGQDLMRKLGPVTIDGDVLILG